jgi:hypothetical protein
MPLPPPDPRTHFHTRQVAYRGYHREDGLWDLEGELTDTKRYDIDIHGERLVPAGEPIHGMAIRLTVDDEFVIRAIATSMASTPFTECQQASPPMQKMIGVRLGPGWRQAIDRALGGVQGCTHLRELLFNIATLAYQTIPTGKAHLREQQGIPEAPSDQPPYQVGRCLAWDFNGAVVKRHMPEFAGWQPLQRVPPERS